jgi:hypothetical protein
MMKNILNLLILVVALSGCKSYIQIFETNSTNTNEQNGYYVFENDTIKITYTFWSFKGIMAFSIYNKLDKPLYIDWKNSSFICNEQKLDYWQEEFITKGISRNYTNLYYWGPTIIPAFLSSSGTSISSSNTVKPERISFIPPKSIYNRSQFFLFPNNSYEMNPKCKTLKEKRNDNPKKSTTIKYEDYNISNTPLKFRNYLALSLKENDASFYFVDNFFYLLSVKEMNYKHYRGKYLGIDDKGRELFEKKYKKPTSFFIRMVEDYY